MNDPGAILASTVTAVSLSQQGPVADCVTQSDASEVCCHRVHPSSHSLQLLPTSVPHRSSRDGPGIDQCL